MKEIDTYNEHINDAYKVEFLSLEIRTNLCICK